MVERKQVWLFFLQIKWELFPHGDHGLPPPGGNPNIAEEGHILPLPTGYFYSVFRTTQVSFCKFSVSCHHFGNFTFLLFCLRELCACMSVVSDLYWKRSPGINTVGPTVIDPALVSCWLQGYLAASSSTEKSLRAWQTPAFAKYWDTLQDGKVAKLYRVPT